MHLAQTRDSNRTIYDRLRKNSRRSRSGSSTCQVPGAVIVEWKGAKASDEGYFVRAYHIWL